MSKIRERRPGLQEGGVSVTSAAAAGHLQVVKLLRSLNWNLELLLCATSTSLTVEIHSRETPWGGCLGTGGWISAPCKDSW